MLLGRPRALLQRLGQDVTGPSRFTEYEAILRRAQASGYALVSLRDFHAGRVTTPPNLLILRHDVDIRDGAGNRAFFAMERRLGASSTFYFRLSTAPAHRGLIRDLRDQGFEVGYHFEEAATVAKRRHLRSRDQLEHFRPEIEDLFRRNVALFRTRWSADLVSAASHGDWINRRLGVTNRELISPATMSESGLQFEAYDPQIMNRADVYVSDVATPPARWKGNYGPDEAITDNRSTVYMLTHERRWHAGRGGALRSDLERIGGTIAYDLGR